MAVLKVGVGEFRHNVKHEGKVWEEWPLTTFHDLRHSFGTSLAMAGVPLPKIQKWRTIPTNSDRLETA
jgi:integrase